MNEVTFEILKIVVIICSCLISVYLIPYLDTLKKDKKYGQVIEIIEVAVKSAEQVIGSGQGSLKKAEVVKFVSEWLTRNGIKIMEDQIDQLIECAVYKMKQEAN